MSGYAGGHYDDGYGQPGHGDSYYQDDHAQGYYDHQGYNDGYYDNGYSNPVPLWTSVAQLTTQATVVITTRAMATRTEDTMREVIRMITTGISTTTRLVMAGVAGVTSPRRTLRPSVISP